MQEITIGRGPECTIVVNHDSVSRVHARILRQPAAGTYCYCDMRLCP